MTRRQLQRHDPFFRRLLDQPKAAAALLREHLPAEVAALLVDEAPEPLEGSFVSARMRAYRTDRLFKTRTKTGRPVLVLTLIEHKSSPEPRTPLQLLGYQVQILEHWSTTAGNDKHGKPRPLPALITLVVYNGTTEWDVPLSLVDATDADPVLRPWILDYRYSLLSLRSVPDRSLSAEKVLRAGLLILKHARNSKNNREQLLVLLRAASDLGEEDLVATIYYLVGDPDGPQAEAVRAIINDILPGEGERIMSTAAEQWKAEGEAKGRIEGRAEGEAKGKAQMLLRQLQRRFKTIPEVTEARIASAGIAQLDDWIDRFVDAETLADIFGSNLTH